MRRRAEVLQAQGRWEAAADVWQRAADDPGLELEQSGQALLEWADVLRRMGRFDTALPVFDRTIREFSDSPRPSLRELAHMGALNKALMLIQGDKSREAIRICEDLLDRAGRQGHAELAAFVPHFLLAKARAYRSLERWDRCLGALQAFLARFESSRGEIAPELVAQARYEEGQSLSALGRTEEALASYQKIQHLAGSAPAEELESLAAEALTNQIATLFQLERVDEALAQCTEAEPRLAASSNPVVQAQAGWALYNAAVALDGLGRQVDATMHYERVVDLYGFRPEEAFDEVLSKSLYNLAGFAGREGRWEDSLAAYDRILARVRTPCDRAQRLQVRLAMLGRIGALIHVSRAEEAIAQADAFQSAFAEDRDAPSDQVAQALYQRGFARLFMNHPAGWVLALEDFQQAERRANPEHLPAIRVVQARALLKLEKTLEAEALIQGALEADRDTFIAEVLSPENLEDPRLQALFQRLVR